MCTPLQAGTPRELLEAHTWSAGLLGTGIADIIANFVAGAVGVPLSNIGVIGGIFAVAAASTVLCCAREGPPTLLLSRLTCAFYLTLIANAVFACMAIGLMVIWIVLSAQCRGSSECLGAVALLWVSVAFNLVSIVVSGRTLVIVSRARRQYMHVAALPIGMGGDTPVVEAQVVMVGNPMPQAQTAIVTDVHGQGGQELPSATAVPINSELQQQQPARSS